MIENLHYDTINSVEPMNNFNIATGSDDGFVHLWDIRAKKCFKSFNFENKRVGCMKFIRKSCLVISNFSNE
jgi:WD40 repeat protein